MVRLADLRDRLVVFAVVTGIFLPVRLLFYTYVSSHWIGSLGLVSSMMLLITLLAHKGKLGFFGRIFVEQMTKSMRGRSGVIAIGLSVVLITYLGSTLVWIDRGDTVYSGEKQVVAQLIFSGSSPNASQMRYMGQVLQSHPSEFIPGLSRFDQVISMTYAILNDMMGGWLVNLDTILLVEQFEILGLVIFYRKVVGHYLLVPSTAG